MPATFILTSATISHINLSLFIKLLDMSCLGIIGVEGNSEIPAIWRIYNRYKQAEEKRQRHNEKGIFAAERQRRKMKIVDTHSGTFGCPNAQPTASQPKEPSFCRLTIC